MRYIVRILARILLETPVRIHLSLRHGFAEKGRFDTSSGCNGLLFSFSFPHRSGGDLAHFVFLYVNVSVHQAFTCSSILLVKCFFLHA